MLNLKDLELRPHDRDFFSTQELGVAFDPKSEKTCPRWLRFLEETVQTPEPIAQLQEFCGYCLTRDTRFEKSVLLVGPGADGKSTFLRILRRLVGEENTSAVNFKDLENEFSRSGLFGKLLNISTEVSTKALDSEFFKGIVSGDKISAAFKHKNQFFFAPYCKLAFAANKLPRVLDNTDGYFRKILPVRFKKQFLGKDADIHLSEKLEAELSEIFHWALFGLQRLWRNGHFTDCEETQNLMMEYRRVNNPVMCFVEDRCELNEFSRTEKKKLFDEYVDYCSDCKFRPMNRENFFRELKAAVTNLRQIRPRIDGKPQRMVQGIGLLPLGDSN